MKKKATQGDVVPPEANPKEKDSAVASQNPSTKGQNPQSDNPTAPPTEIMPKRVRVICNGTLGTALLKKGDVTENPEYVALLETKRGRTLVEEVK